jgi:hypothetical protein
LLTQKIHTARIKRGISIPLVGIHSPKDWIRAAVSSAYVSQLMRGCKGMKIEA